MKAPELESPITGNKFNPLSWKLWVGGIVIIVVILFGLLGGRWLMAKISGTLGIGGDADDDASDFFRGDL